MSEQNLEKLFPKCLWKLSKLFNFFARNCWKLSSMLLLKSFSRTKTLLLSRTIDVELLKAFKTPNISCYDLLEVFLQSYLPQELSRAFANSIKHFNFQSNYFKYHLLNSLKLIEFNYFHYFFDESFIIVAWFQRWFSPICHHFLNLNSHQFELHPPSTL